MTPSVLVTDGEERSSLAAVRSLGRAGYDVVVSARTPCSLAGSSRYVSRTYTTPDPLTEAAEYLGTLDRIIRGAAIDVLLPMTEASLLAVLPGRDELGTVRIPFPSYERFRSITDKARVAEIARDVGIAVPRQVILESPEDSLREPIGGLNCPIVLKPARSIGEAEAVQRKVGVIHVETPGEFRSAAGSLPPQAYPLLVQEKIEGIGAGVFLLVKNGSVVAKFAHRRIREKPPSGGVSVCRESAAADTALVESSRALLERFDWEGVAMVEYKIAAATGEPYIMEVNPRFWGSLQLAIDAGVDFPRLLIDMALDKNVEPVTVYDLGICTRWWWGEVDHVLSRAKQARGSGGWASGIREFFSAARVLFTGWGGQTRAEVWRREDPRPFLRETREWIASL